ncbi:hypothetical protein TWF730_004466 [Orbilia blumenaviensis]|uniref:BTB domain-containing protein n=1 Tax=Orbilia blumenaviensis TaxID=1796055 RepID=A0AAV9U106_9PEZI
MDRNNSRSLRPPPPPSVSRPRKGPIISNFEPGVMKLLEMSTFSDIVVLVGEDEKEYKLHRNIISVGSDFFEARCREGTFLEGKERVIRLPEIDTESFDIIIKWIYRGGYTLPEFVDTDAFCRVFEAADFLRVQELKTEMQEKLVTRLTREFIANEKNEKTIDDPLKLYNSIAANSAISDWHQLRRIADKVFPF